MNRSQFFLAILSALAIAAPRLGSAAEMKPSAPIAGWLYDETYDGFGSTIHDSFGTMNGLTAKGNPSNSTPDVGGPTTAIDVPFTYSGNTAFSTIGGPTTGSTAIWHGVFDAGSYSARMGGASAVTLSAWLKYEDGTLATDGSTNARNNNANAFVAMTIDGSHGGSGLYLNLPTGTAPDTTSNTNRLGIIGTSIATDAEQSYVTTATLTPGAWNHIVAILDFANNQIRASINGSAFETANVGFGSPVLTPGSVVATQPDILPTRSFRSEYIGLMDEVAMWPTALSQDNVDWLQQHSLHDLIVPGDFNHDGKADGADFATWQANFPATSGATLVQGDADGDGDVDGADFVVWQTHLGTAGAANASIVPEPMSILLLVGSMPLLAVSRRSGRSRARQDR